jgi:hypothetical protein
MGFVVFELALEVGALIGVHDCRDGGLAAKLLNLDCGELVVLYQLNARRSS